MAGYIVPITRWFYQGLPASGALVHVYGYQNTSLQEVFADADLTTPVANPVVCDSNGEAVFYLPETASGADGAYRFYVTTSGGTLIRDIQPVYPTSGITGSIANGQCQLIKNGSLLQLRAWGGNKLWINGSVRDLPNTVSLSASGLAADTLYYIYAYMNGADVALEASTTSPTLTSGIYQRTSGGVLRTLVGMARTITGPAWQDTATQRFVRSWYNDPGIGCKNVFTTGRSTTSTTFTELNTEIRCEFLAWDGEVFNAAASVCAATASAGNYIYSALAFDSTTAAEAPAMLMTYSSTGVYQPTTIAVARTGLTRGYHYMTLLGASQSGAVSNTWLATTLGSVASTTISLSSARG
jgi:hypothetical protein